MIVDDLDFVRGSILPDKAEPPLIVDPDAVLSDPVAFQGLQAIAWRHPEVVEPDRGVQHSQLAARHGQDVRGKALRCLTDENERRAFTPETFDHCALCIA